MSSRIYINRRELLAGFGAVTLTSSLPRPVPKSAKVVRVVCVAHHAGHTWAVFDDLPQTIFRLDEDFTVEPGMEFLA
jgi:hypothetical protein